MVSGLTRIIGHWTAGTGVVSSLDRKHYHYIIASDGTVVKGLHRPESNLGSLRSGTYAAHTLNLNSGSIGVALAAMAGAIERPFSAGKSPITVTQIDAYVRLCADLCIEHAIPVERTRVLSHAEVEPTLAIRQRGKWDIAWIPGMTLPGDPVAVGDVIRDRIRREIATRGAGEPVAQAVVPTVVLRRGDRGSDVIVLQKMLGMTGKYLDGIFGPRTEEAVRGIQRAHQIGIDGIVGPKTWNVIVRK